MLQSLLLSSIVLLGFPLANGAAVPLAKRLQAVKRAAFAPPSKDAITTNYAPIKKSTKQSRSNAILGALMQRDDLAATPSETLTAGDGGQEYLISIEWAGTSYTVILDTGSSDTWLIASGFECVNASGQEQSEASCDFGPVGPSSFEDGQISDENFNITYGDGEFVTGIVGYEDVTVAGLTVTKQEVALGTLAYWVGDGTSSGLMGLAYESLTSAYSGTNPADDSSSNRDEYSPIFQTMVSEGLSSASFSLALERGTGGYIAFGGLPPVSGISNSTTFTSTPIEYLTISDVDAYTFYTINAAITYGSTETSTQQYIVDSGTTLIYTPTSVARAVNAAFKPAAKYLSDEEAYFVDCSATPPTFKVDIAGTSFTVDPADLIYQNVVDPDTGYCLTGVQDGGSGPYILGDVFLQNVVAVFDVGASEMRFAAHETY